MVTLIEPSKDIYWPFHICQSDLESPVTVLFSWELIVDKREGGREGLDHYYIIYVMMIFVTAKIMVFPNCQVSWHLTVSTLWYYSCHFDATATILKIDWRNDVPFDGSSEIVQEKVHLKDSTSKFIVKTDFARNGRDKRMYAILQLNV